MTNQGKRQGNEKKKCTEKRILGKMGRKNERKRENWH